MDKKKLTINKLKKNSNVQTNQINYTHLHINHYSRQNQLIKSKIIHMKYLAQ